MKNPAYVIFFFVNLYKTSARYIYIDVQFCIRNASFKVHLGQNIGFFIGLFHKNIGFYRFI